MKMSLSHTHTYIHSQTLNSQKEKEESYSDLQDSVTSGNVNKDSYSTCGACIPGLIYFIRPTHTESNSTWKLFKVYNFICGLCATFNLGF